MGFTLLERRGARYYYRQRVPKDLQPHFGRGEFRRSLGTADPREARRRVKMEVTKAEMTFEMMRRGAMTTEELRRIAEEYLHSTLDYCEDVQEILLPATHAEKAERLGSYADLHDRYTQALSDLDVKQTRRRGLKLAEDLVTQVLKERGLTLAKDSEEYAYLTRELLKRAIEVCNVQGERLTGNYSNQYDRGRLYGSQVVTQGEARETPKAGPLLSEVITAYVQEHLTLKKWTEKTEQENTAILAVFLELIGDRDITAISHHELMRVRDDMVKLPSNPRKGKGKAGKSLRELIKIGLPPMSLSTARKYLVRLASFYKWAVTHEYTSKNVAAGLTLGKKKVKASDARKTYEREDIQRLFDALEYDPRQPERFWIPLVGLWSGMRLDEICQLHLEDVKDIGGIPCFDVNDHGTKKVKTAASVRQVPIHPALVDLGFLEYVKALQAHGVARLWPNLSRGRDGYSHVFTKVYQRLNRKAITQDSKKVFHSFRHGMSDFLKQSGELETVAAAILGHEHPNMTFGTYGKEYRVSLLLDSLQKVDFGVDLEILRVKVPSTF